MSDAAERLRLRYPPPRVGRSLVIGAVAVGTAIGLVWLVWAALFHASPAVSGQMSGFQIVSDTVLALGEDYSPVGEQQVEVEGAADRVVNTQVRLVTLRRAMTASVKECDVS